MRSFSQHMEASCLGVIGYNHTSLFNSFYLQSSGISDRIVHTHKGHLLMELQVRMQASSTHTYTQLACRISFKSHKRSYICHISQLCIQLMLPQQFQSQPQLFYMFFLILRINKNSIKKNKNKPIQRLIETLFTRHIDVGGAFVNLNDTTTTS